MSTVLAIDCCLKITGVALMIDGVILDSEQQDLGRKQTAELPLMVKGMLERNDVAFDALDYVALTNGPGYFTGIRVGAAYASGLAYASGAKVIPISSLNMLVESYRLFGHEDTSIQSELNTPAENHMLFTRENTSAKSERSGKILAVVYAGHGYVYAECQELLAAGEYTLDEIREWLMKNPDAVVISDDPERSGISEAVRVRPSISALCELANNRLNEAIPPLELKISYYRAPQGVQ